MNDTREPLQGASGTSYYLGDAGVEGLRLRYETLVARFGGIRPALVSIATMLDTPAVNAAEGVRPDVVAVLLDAARKLEP